MRGGKTALHLAVEHERLDAACVLIQHSAPEALDLQVKLFPYGTCPVQTVGHAGTNLGRAAGRVRFLLDAACVLIQHSAPEALDLQVMSLDFRIPNVSPYGHCPVHTFGHEGTSLGRAAGRDRLRLDAACVLIQHSAPEALDLQVMSLTACEQRANSLEYVKDFE